MHGCGGPGSLSSCFISNCVIKLAMSLFEMDDFEINDLAIKSLMSDTYTAIKKLNVRHLHYRISPWEFSYPHCSICT